MYTTTQNSFGQVIIIKTVGDAMTSFTENPDNTDYQAYLKWLDEGNTPEPAEASE